MDEACESLNKPLTVSVDNASDALKSPNSLLFNLPEELLIVILVQVPLNIQLLKRLRLICRRINDLTNTKAYYHDVAQADCPDTKSLFFLRPQEID